MLLNVPEKYFCVEFYNRISHKARYEIRITHMVMYWLPIVIVLISIISKYFNIFQQTLSVHNTEKTCFFKSLFRKYCPCSLTDYKSMFQSKIFRITCHNIKYIDSFFNEYYKKSNMVHVFPIDASTNKLHYENEIKKKQKKIK